MTITAGTDSINTGGAKELTVYSKAVTGGTLNIAVLRDNEGLKGVSQVFVPTASAGGYKSNTAITTVGAGTLTAASLVGGLVTRTGPVAAYTDTTDTAVNIITAILAAVPSAPVGFSSVVDIKNTVNFAATLAAGAGVTLSGQTIIPPLSVGRFLMTYTGAGAVTVLGLGFETMTVPVQVANTSIATVGAGTLTAAAMVGSVISRTGSVAAYTDTTDTAVAIIAALPNAQIGQSWELVIKNTVAFAETLAAGAGVTLTGQTIIPPNSSGRFLVTYTGAGAVSVLGLSMVPLTTSPLEVATALTTVGAGTITAAGIAGGATTRGGAQSGSAFTDTTDTAANILAALPNGNVGQSFEYTYQNNTNAQATLAGGANVTLPAGNTIVPANTWARFLVTVATASTVTLQCLAAGVNVPLPKTQFTSISAGNGTLAAGNMEGADFVALASSGATAFTTRTAAQIIAGIPNAQIGQSYLLRVYNTNGGTLTLTGGSGVTITGTATIATAIFRDYTVTITGASTVTMQNIGSGVAN